MQLKLIPSHAIELSQPRLGLCSRVCFLSPKDLIDLFVLYSGKLRQSFHLLSEETCHEVSFFLQGTGQGFFDKEGLNVELIEFQNSANGLNAIIASAAILRTGIAEYFAANGKMPDDLIDLGYDHDWLPSNVLESIDVQTGGVVVLRFAPRPLREVVLTPDSAAGSIRGWDCESRDFPGIEQIAGCHFTGTIP